MPSYKCLVRGEAFPGCLADEDGEISFYATRYVEASDLEDAEEKVVQLLREDERLHLSKDYIASAKAHVFVEEIQEIEPDQIGKNTGFIFFKGDPDQKEDSVLKELKEKRK